MVLLLNVDRVHKEDEAVDCWPQGDVVKSRGRILWQTQRTHLWIIFSFSWSATALHLYNSDFTSVASRAWTVSTLTWSSCAGEHSIIVLTDPEPRLDETLVDRQIDTVLAIDRHQAARRSNQHMLNCVRGVRASLLKHALEPLLCSPSLWRWPPRTPCVRMRGQSLWAPTPLHRTTSATSPLWTAPPFERCKLKIDPLLPTLHSNMRFCGMHTMPSTHPMRTFSSLIASLMLFCVNIEELLRNSATASFVCRSTVSMMIPHKLSTNKRVPTRELANQLADAVGEQRERLMPSFGQFSVGQFLFWPIPLLANVVGWCGGWDENWPKEEKWRKQELVKRGRSRVNSLPCRESRNLVKIVAGHEELEMVFKPQEELVVRDFVRFAAPALAGSTIEKDISRSTPSCCRPQTNICSKGPSGPRTSLPSSLSPCK